MLDMEVVICLRGMRSAQPSDEVRKIDHKLMIYRRFVKERGGKRLIESPISPAAFKGALRHAACVVVSTLGRFRDEFESLFGSEIGARCGYPAEELAPPSSREGKLKIELVDSDFRSADAVEIRPRVRIDGETGAVDRGMLVLSEAVSKRIEVRFRLYSTEPLTDRERELLEMALNLMRGWGVGGWASVGFGLVEEVSW